MRTTVKASIIVFVIFTLSITSVLSQNRAAVAKARNYKEKVVVVKNKKYHVKKTRVYHPCWAPKANFHRRWVYFPKYNFYWDNYRNVYVIRNKTVWVVSKTVPTEIKYVDLSKEKSVELSDENDEQDSIQDKNTEHQNEYKIE